MKALIVDDQRLARQVLRGGRTVEMSRRRSARLKEILSL
jgi:hypothetical protein